MCSISGNRDVEYVYVQPVPGNLCCALCEAVLDEPVQASCGERFHQGCFKTLIKESENDCLCPKCGIAIESSKCWRDVFADRELSHLEVFCLWHDGGCEWTGYQQSLKEHLESCEFQLIPCTNSGCCAKLPRSELREHMEGLCDHRVLKCPHCDVIHTASETDIHKGVCPLLPVSCPFGCNPEVLLPREELAVHVKECPQRVTKCPITGCVFNGREQELEKHMTTDVTGHVTDLSKEVKLIRSTVAELKRHVEEKAEDQTRLIQNDRQTLKQLQERVGVAENKVADLAAQQKLMQHKTLEACYQSVDNVQKEYRAKVAGIEQHLRLLTEKCIKFEEIVSMQASRIQQLETQVARYGNFPDTSQSVQKQFEAQDRVMASHDIKLAEHSLRLDMMDCKNTNGVLLWKITEIRRRRRDAVSGKTPSIYSQPFYTSPNGYKMCARLYPNGDGMGRGTHLSLFFVVMRGEYDSLLPWPFKHKVTLVLIDQDGRSHISDAFRPDPTSSSFQKPRNEMNVASGCPLFVPLTTLDTGGYIRDDVMFIKMIVDSTELCRPDQR